MELIDLGYRKIMSVIGSKAIRYRRQRRWLNQARERFAENELLLKSPNRTYRHDIDQYWREHYGKAVNPLWHVALAHVIGKEDVRYIPNYIWYEEILPFFNNVWLRPAYIDKNVSDIILRDTRVPETVVKRIHGRYYSHNYEWISRPTALDRILSAKSEQIIKGSFTDDGVGVRVLHITGQEILLHGRATSLDELEANYGPDFVIQTRISQHPTMAEPHSSSVNTVRIVTFRWKDDIAVLLSYARFGTGGRTTDNASTGGVSCGIGEGGRLNPTAVDQHGEVHERHPTTGYSFDRRLDIPNYKKMCLQAVKLHRRIHHFDIVSWDFAVGEDGEPIFLEVNFQGASFVYQAACRRPLFGELTEEVLELIRNSSGRSPASRSSSYFADTFGCH